MVSWLSMLSMPDAGCKLCISSEHRGERPSQSVFCLSVATIYRGQTAICQQSSHRGQNSSLSLSMSLSIKLDAAHSITLWHRVHHSKLLNRSCAVHEKACSSSLLVQDDHVGQVRQRSVVVAPVQQLVRLQVCQLDDVSCDGVACDDLLSTNSTCHR